MRSILLKPKKDPLIYLRYFFSNLTLLCFFSTNLISAKIQENNIPFIAYGNLFGHLEPCGCDPLTDLGGVRRVSSLTAQIKSKDAKTLAFDLGNNFDPSKINESETHHLKQALDLIKPDASLINEIELKFHKQTLGQRAYVLSNAKSSFLKKKNIHPFVTQDKTIIFGYLEAPNFETKLIEGSPSLWQKWHKDLLGYKDYKKILLFSGADNTLKSIHKENLFDLIISSNTKTKDDKNIYEEQNKSYLLLRQFDDFYVSMVPCLGRGVLTHKKKEKTKLFEFKNQKKSLELSLNKQSLLNEKLSTLIPEIEIYWLDQKYQLGSPLASFLEEYANFKKNTFKKLGALRQKDLKQSPYTGAQTCKNCHAEAYKTWKKTKHSHAYETLTTKGKDEDPSCITCHVLAWNEKGGFVSQEKSPHFTHVQCETCHGPRKEHAQNPTIKNKTLPFNSCETCHNLTHSPKFDKQLYWKKIVHK